MSAAKTIKMWNKMAEKYSKQPIRDEKSYQFKIEKAQEYLRPDMEVLEFGCGTGTTALIHAPKVKHITALDVADKMIDIAKAKAVEQNIDNATFEVSSIEAFDAPAESFDVIMGYNILHLLPDDKAALAKVRKLLKPGGLFISSTACIGTGFSIWKIVVPIMRLVGKAPFVRFYKLDQLAGNIEDAGFTIDYRWVQPAKIGVLFAIAKKPA